MRYIISIMHFYDIFSSNNLISEIRCMRIYLNKKATNLSKFVAFCGGDEGIRTPDLLHAKQALSQLSYTPT